MIRDKYSAPFMYSKSQLPVAQGGQLPHPLIPMPYALLARQVISRGHMQVATPKTSILFIVLIQNANTPKQVTYTLEQFHWNNSIPLNTWNFPPFAPIGHKAPPQSQPRAASPPLAKRHILYIPQRKGPE